MRIPNPALVVLCGPAGSGKSTFARRHFPETAIVSSDRCRAMISDDEANIRVSREAFELFHHLIETRLHHHRLTVADSTAVLPAARRILRQIARRSQVPVLTILFDVPETTCLRWDELRTRRVGQPVIHRQWEHFQHALRAVSTEGYSQVVVLGEADLGGTQVAIVGASGQRGPAAMS